MASLTEGSHWDQTKFDAVLRNYLKVCTRDMVKAINTKGYFIARGATRLTIKADKPKIKSDLLKLVILKREDGTYSYGPLLAGLINKRRGAKGEKGLYGRDMAEEMKRIMAARNRSVAFLKSGWLPAIKKLEPLADKKGAPQMDRTAKQFGRDRGDANPAVDGAEIVARIINEAIAKHDHKDALGKYAGKGLAQAFEDEANSMLDYIMRHLGPATEAANAKL